MIFPENLLNTSLLNTLYGKTFLILGTQLVITWLSTVVVLKAMSNLYGSVGWITGGIRRDGSLDLDINWHVVKPYYYALLVVDITAFLLLIIIGESNLYIGIPLFTVWSIITGIYLALSLISVDESLGSKILALTALITFATGVIGSNHEVNYSTLSGILFSALLLLVFYSLLRIIISIPSGIARIWTILGISVFIGYLLYDFNRLSQLNEHAVSNTWSVAMKISISIYLDILNLFLDLLDLIGK